MERAEALTGPVVILNPTANRGKMDLYRSLLRSRIEQEQAEYVETSRSGEARERAMLAAAQGRTVIVVGGDGTLNEVVNGLLIAGRRVPLGIVAAGSGNDYAWNTLKLPKEPEAAIERAFHGQLIDADAGIVNGQYFANSFSVGIDADIAVAASKMKKIPLMSGGRLYYTTTVKQLLFGYHRCPRLTFSLKDEAYQSEPGKRYVLLAVTNGPTYGAGFRINPQADHVDGYFDVCAIDYTPLLRALTLLPSVKKGEHGGEPEVKFYRARTVCIESKRPVNMQIDGETTSATRFEAEALPGALWVHV